MIGPNGEETQEIIEPESSSSADARGGGGPSRQRQRMSRSARSPSGPAEPEDAGGARRPGAEEPTEVIEPEAPNEIIEPDEPAMREGGR